MVSRGFLSSSVIKLLCFAEQEMWTKMD